MSSEAQLQNKLIAAYEEKDGLARDLKQCQAQLAELTEQVQAMEAVQTAKFDADVR